MRLSCVTRRPAAGPSPGGLEGLADNPMVDPNRLAAIGFCFGGTTVWSWLISGADLKGVVCFHGGLLKAQVEEVKGAKAAIMVLHGADDHHIKAEDIAAFQEAMRQGGARLADGFFGGAVHSFTNPEAGSDKASGVAYDPRTRGAPGSICRTSSRRSSP